MCCTSAEDQAIRLRYNNYRLNDLIVWPAGVHGTVTPQNNKRTTIIAMEDRPTKSEDKRRIGTIANV